MLPLRGENGEGGGGPHRSELLGGVQQVEEEAANAAIHIQDQVGCFGQRVLLHTHSVLQVLGAGEELLGVVLQQLHPLVLVILRYGNSC